MPLTRASASAIGGQHAADPAEFAQQRLGERLGVAARDREREQIFDQLVIEQRLAAALEQPLAQPGAVARGVVGRAASSAIAANATPAPRRAQLRDARRHAYGRAMVCVAASMIEERGDPYAAFARLRPWRARSSRPSRSSAAGAGRAVDRRASRSRAAISTGRWPRAGVPARYTHRRSGARAAAADQCRDRRSRASRSRRRLDRDADRGRPVGRGADGRARGACAAARAAGRRARVARRDRPAAAAARRASPSRCPRSTLDVADARMRLETPYGRRRAEAERAGRLDDGFAGQLAAVGDALTRRRLRGRRASRAAVRDPDRRGRAASGRARCARRGVALRPARCPKRSASDLDLDAGRPALDRWHGHRRSGHRCARHAGGAIAAGGVSGDGRASAAPRQRRRASLDLAAPAVRAGAGQAARLVARGDVSRRRVDAGSTDRSVWTVPRCRRG